MRFLKRWTLPDSYAGKSWPNWYVGLGRHRDSGCLSDVNFDVFLEEVRKASNGLTVKEADMGTEYVQGQGWVDRVEEISTVYIVHESHWLVGWVEWIAIHESDTGAIGKAEELLRQLDDYPVLDEDRWSERETEEIDKFWRETSLKHRVEWCKDHGDSIFAARHDYAPEHVFDWLREDWN